MVSGSKDDSALAQVGVVFLRSAETLSVFQVPDALLMLVCFLHWVKGSR